MKKTNEKLTFDGKTLIPLGNKVIVKRDEAEEKTKGGIYLPDVGKERPKKGKVLAVGEGRLTGDEKMIPMTVEEGDEVIFSSYAGNEVEIAGEKLLIMAEEDILAFIR